MKNKTSKNKKTKAMPYDALLATDTDLLIKIFKK